MILKIIPQATPRPRVGKHGAYYPEKYRDYKRALGLIIKSVCKTHYKGAIKIEVGFYMPIPKSLSKKKQEELAGEWHTKKPDTDNLIKGVKDALEGIAFNNDSQVCHETSYKMYSKNPRIEVVVSELK